METPERPRSAGSPLQQPVATLTGGPLPDRAGWRAVGEISWATQAVWERLLGDLVDRDERVCHLELSAVTFVDVAGATSLVAVAQALEEGRRIVLCRPPTSLRRMLDLLWPDLASI